VSPSDSTGAIGPGSYIEMVNLEIGIYSRSTLAASDAATLGSLTGQPDGSLSDPQIIWDPATNRFYYVVLNTATQNLQWGFSKSANPSTIPYGFCNYTANFGYGLSLADYPKLGEPRHVLLIGEDRFTGQRLTGNVAGLTTSSGGQVITPCPGVQTDP